MYGIIQYMPRRTAQVARIVAAPGHSPHDFSTAMEQNLAAVMRSVATIAEVTLLILMDSKMEGMKGEMQGKFEEMNTKIEGKLEGYPLIP